MAVLAKHGLKRPQYIVSQDEESVRNGQRHGHELFGYPHVIVEPLCVTGALLLTVASSAHLVVRVLVGLIAVVANGSIGQGSDGLPPL
eukprot:7481094-Pyramimonas_sp.AAC.1